MSVNEAKTAILNNKTALGIEFGSTRIKAVLVDDKYDPIASGSYEWENRYENGVWTYSLDDIHKGLQGSYSDLVKDVQEKYGVELTSVGALGISAMMHGYLAFDSSDRLLVPFRTWRNTNTGAAAEKLTALFNFNIPLRWSVAHLYQCVLDGESHLQQLSSMNTLAGYVHYLLTSRRVLGVGDAAGMFPIDPATGQYDAKMLAAFDRLVADKNYPWTLADLLPEILPVGTPAGTLTPAGAALLDPSGTLQPGAVFCPPEGDAGTGMVATNSVAPGTGNVSAGTSVFAMVVLDRPLARVHREIDMVTTPAGDLVAMVHCNNCTSDLNAWVGLFAEFAECFGIKADKNKLFSTLYQKAMEGDKDCGGMIACNYYSGEPVTGLEEGRPMFLRRPDSHLGLANFMRSHLYASLATLKIGLDILLKEEDVKIDSITGHGGLFKTKGVGQSILAAAMNAPISVMETAGEGGAWGMALLAAYMLFKKDGQSLGDYLDSRVFAERKSETMEPDPADVAGFEKYTKQYQACLAAEKAAVQAF